MNEVKWFDRGSYYEYPTVYSSYSQAFKRVEKLRTAEKISAEVLNVSEGGDKSFFVVTRQDVPVDPDGR